MKEHKCGDLPSFCGRFCSQDQVTHLMTRLGIVEGEILQALETNGDLTLHRLMEILEWQPCEIAMAVGSLLRQGLIRSVEMGEEVFLGVKERKENEAKRKGKHSSV